MYMVTGQIFLLEMDKEGEGKKQDEVGKKEKYCCIFVCLLVFLLQGLLVAGVRGGGAVVRVAPGMEGIIASLCESARGCPS